MFATIYIACVINSFALVCKVIDSTAYTIMDLREVHKDYYNRLVPEIK